MRTHICEGQFAMQAPIDLPLVVLDDLRQHMRATDYAALTTAWAGEHDICGGVFDIGGGVFEAFTWDRTGRLRTYPEHRKWYLTHAVRVAAAMCDDIELRVLTHT